MEGEKVGDGKTLRWVEYLSSRYLIIKIENLVLLIFVRDVI